MAPYALLVHAGTNGTQGNAYHDKEAHSDGLADLDELALVGYTHIPISL